SHLFKWLYFEDRVQKSHHPLIGREAVAGKGPADKIPEAHPAGDLFHVRHRAATAIDSADQRPYAGSGHKTDGDILFLEDFQNSQMGDAAGESAAQCDSNFRN